jgi:hypothetical protein
MANVQLNETIAAALQAQAAAQGLTVDAYLEHVLLASPPKTHERMSLEEWDRLLDEEADLGPSPIGTFSRADLYVDHD